MVVLAFDSSAPSASAAVVADGKLICEMYLNVGLTHSATLMPLIKSCLEMSNYTIDNIDAIAVTNGPGSFTGVRIGVATAKGLAQPKGIDCVAVSTLEAIAYPLLGNDCIAASVMDARCCQVYGAFFDCSGSELIRLSEDDAFSFDELIEKCKAFDKKVVLIGDGAQVAYDYMTKKGFEINVANPSVVHQRAAGVAFIAEKAANKNNTVSATELVPSYLRLAQAERELKKKEQNK